MPLRIGLLAVLLMAAGPPPPPPSRDTEQLVPGPYGNGKSLYEYFFGDQRRPSFDPQLRCWSRCPPAQQRRPT